MSEDVLHSVDNALCLLEILATKGPELGLSEISRIMGLGKSTTHRLLTTLERRNFVMRSSNTGKYKLGMKIVNLGSEILGQVNITKEAHPLLEYLSRSTGETSHLGFYSQGYVTFVDKVVGNHDARMTSTIGCKKPAYCTGMGKVLVASLPDLRLEEYLRAVHLYQLTPYTITNLDELRSEIKKIREQGYSEDQQESEEGLVCFAAPVHNHLGEITAAISVSGSASRMNNKKQVTVKELKWAAAELSKNCGYAQ